MKKVLLIVGISLALMSGAQADIGFQVVNSSGIYLAGGDFGSGPWPTSPSLFQVVWSQNPPADTGVLPGLANPGEFIVAAGPSPSYGYVVTPLIVVTSGDVGGADPNAGALWMRIYESDSPDIGSSLYSATPIDTATLPNYVPSDPSTQPQLDFVPTAQEVNGGVIPEPATVALWGLGLLTIMVRRRVRG